MRFIAEFILSVVELLESEARALRANIVGIAYLVVFLAAGIIVLLVGGALILWGFYKLLVTALDPIASTFIIGGATLLIGFFMLYGVKRMAR